MRRSAIAFFSVLFSISLFVFQMPAAAQDAKRTPGAVFLPKALTPRLSAQENTLYNGLPLLAVVSDPKPSGSSRKIPAPARLSEGVEKATSSFSITYIPNGGADLWGETCYTFPEEAKASFNAAAAIWANTLESDVPITINACWADLGASSTLGYSGGGPFHRDFAGAARANTWYVGSLANALSGSDISPSEYDMHITYNRNFNWYYGTDGNPSSTQHDLVTVVMHEICHGLNFSGSMSYSSGFGSWGYNTGYPNIYDVYVKDGSGKDLISYLNRSTALGSALTSNDIWFHGSKAVAANGNSRVKLYAPSSWMQGSSYSHLDYSTFNNTSNQLMVYAISAGESIHDPGAITNGLLQDLGWTSSGGSTPTAGTPASIMVPSTDSDGAYTVSWGPSSTSSVTYILEEATNSSFSDGLCTAYSGSSTNAMITGRSDGATYYYRVKATRTGYTDSSWCTCPNGCLVGTTSLALPVTENFNSSTLPTGWTTQNTGTGITERWGVSNTANAVGTAYEMKYTCQYVNPGTTRLITPAINTVGVSQVTLSFKHFLDSYATGATLRVQTSIDKSTWTDTGWAISSGSSDIGTETIPVTINTSLDSGTTYIAFVVDGNLFRINYWYLDEVSINGTGSVTPTFYVNTSGDCGVKTPCYDTIQKAIDAAESGSLILIAAGTYVDSITLNVSKTLTLQGGWDTSFSTETGNPTIIKAPKATKGSLTLQNVIIKP